MAFIPRRQVFGPRPFDLGASVGLVTRWQVDGWQVAGGGWHGGGWQVAGGGWHGGGWTVARWRVDGWHGGGWTGDMVAGDMVAGGPWTLCQG